MKRLREFSGRTAVITGAASGIGRALALDLAARGTHLALADIDAEGLEATRAAAGARSIHVSTHRLDVSDAAAVGAFPGVVLGCHPGVDFLFNNAGVALGGTFEQIAEADFAWLFDVNFWGVVRMTRAFLPLLRRSDDAALVNVSSLFGLIAPPGQSAYAASKFAVRGFSEPLRAELAGTTIGVTVVHPGGIATAIAKNAREPAGIPAETIARNQRAWNRLLRMSPDAAAVEIVRAVERRRPRVIVGRDARIAALAERIAPVSYGRLLKALSGLLRERHPRGRGADRPIP
jgi:NAD(P)-dependent dehydrogenase (short-subunit alcohol dehydrogenase family)